MGYIMKIYYKVMYPHRIDKKRILPCTIFMTADLKSHCLPFQVGFKVLGLITSYFFKKTYETVKYINLYLSGL